MAESTDYKRFKALCPGPGDRLDRVENGLVAGMPDLNICIDGVEVWIEQKSPKEPVRSTTPLFGSNHKVSQEQQNWFLRQARCGGRAVFLVVTDKRWMLLPGQVAETINKMSVPQLLEIALWHTTKPIKDKQQWNLLRNAIKNSKPLRTDTNSIV